ncbi:hypothetical protein Egran_05825 [Elaphomyces granulatus]|uniref:PUM-HD domain-containing protein n=1 Tax=Elaphomyces granulatus TaxID=519963 RepID=A0A232LRI3_9EURO|nr:hypothetical protein Egran_05825 [Elaphomyces granulatus]
MAFKNGLSDRFDELRFSPRSPTEMPFSTYTSPSPAQPGLISAFQRPHTDGRAHTLQRRFTTDLSKLSSWNLLNQQPFQLTDSLEVLSPATNLHNKSQLFEKKRQHIEYMREQKKRLEADMKLLDMQQEKERQKMDQLARDLAQAGLSGPVSEPTTPPEYRDPGFPSVLSQPRFSASSVTSSPGIFNIFSPSQITSPPAAQSKPTSAQTPTNHNSVHSVPGSRRNSEEDEYFPESVSSYPRPKQSTHRYSMPTTSLASQIRSTVSAFNNPTLDSFSATKYLFSSEDGRATPKDEDRLPTPDIKSYLKMTDPDDKFTTVTNRDDHPGLLSLNSDALDLADSRTPVPESWNTHNRHRSSHQSMPQNGLNIFRLDQLGSPTSENPSPLSGPRHIARHSLELNMVYGGESNPESVNTSNSSSRPTSLQSSYSTSDVPTVKGNGFNATITPPKTHADPFHQHNASLGRIPPNAVNTRSTKDSPERDEPKLHNSQAPPVPLSALQGSAAPFGPQITSSAPPSSLASSAASTPLTAFQAPFYNYNLQAYMPSPMQVNGQLPSYTPHSPYPAGYPPYNNYRFPDPPARGVSSRRSGDNDPTQLSRFGNVPLEHYLGELYGLCKDQHGCRYLQRKLEERNPEHVQMIFTETCMHVVELMTDPFGNYLCQKLLEYSNDEQRTVLINNAAPQLVKIALNQHGTRALQKMIEFISTPEQTQTVIQALRDRVVDLVQDLNGNHVIQKCLNRLSAEDAQFIYDAVGTNCVVVGTHRHGCCVLQRCIDHASGDQRARLIAQITSNAFALVQDPFGNYVVQYILDLAEPHFTDPLCQTFLGNVTALSKQKFSSNVIEKCLRTAEFQLRRQLIDEILIPNELEKMLRDSFANYVVQTAMDFADPETRVRMVEAIRPILPSIRQTPHGRRIAGKMVGSEGSGRVSGSQSGQVTPNESTPGQLPSSMQMSPKPFLYHHNSFPNSNVSQQQYCSQGMTFPDAVASAFASHSASNTPSGGATESSTNIFSPSQQATAGLGTQAQMFGGYF